MSDFLKKVKSLFVVDIPEEGGTTNSENLVSETSKATNVTAPITHMSNVSSEGKVDEKYLDLLLNAIQQQNQEGFDYLEYKQSLQSLEKMPMDEATRFKSAYAMAQTMGGSVVKLVESASIYLNVLGQEQSKFQEAVSKQRAQQIGNREEQLTQLDKTIQQKMAQIQQLTQEIEQHKKQWARFKMKLLNQLSRWRVLKIILLHPTRVWFPKFNRILIK